MSAITGANPLGANLTLVREEMDEETPQVAFTRLISLINVG